MRKLTMVLVMMMVMVLTAFAEIRITATAIIAGEETDVISVFEADTIDDTVVEWSSRLDDSLLELGFDEDVDRLKTHWEIFNGLNKIKDYDVEVWHGQAYIYMHDLMDI